MTKIDDGSVGKNAWNSPEAWKFMRGYNGSRSLVHCDYDWVRGEKAVREIAQDRGWGGMVIGEREVLGKIETKWVFLDRPSDTHADTLGVIYTESWEDKWNRVWGIGLTGDEPDTRWNCWPALAKSSFEEGKMFGADHLHAPFNTTFPGERLEKWAFIRGCEEYGKE